MNVRRWRRDERGGTAQVHGRHSHLVLGVLNRDELDVFAVFGVVAVLVVDVGVDKCLWFLQTGRGFSVIVLDLLVERVVQVGLVERVDFDSCGEFVFADALDVHALVWENWRHHG